MSEGTGTGTLFGVRTAALVQLGEIMTMLGSAEQWPGHGSGLVKEEYDRLDAMILRAGNFNGWATEENVRHAFRAWGDALELGSLEQWLSRYPDMGHPRREVRVGLILAGNVPLVGLHDVICTWLAGHRAQIKLSSQEPELIPGLVGILDMLIPGTAERLHVVDGKLGAVDAIIATGSNNTARYFEHYFGHLPNIIRKSRTSVAVLDGTETEAELNLLGEDIFRYFGLGCRNVSKVYLPQDLELDRLFKGLYPYHEVVNHNKYGNNYDYTRALWLLDQVPFLENGFVLLKEDEGIASPVGALFYQRYSDESSLAQELEARKDSIQCIVGHGHVPFGQAQSPALWDFADGVDTLEFLQGLGQGQYS
jgi:hypothetical protein